VSNRKVARSHSLVRLAFATIAVHLGCGSAANLPEIPEIRSGFEALTVCPSGREAVIPAEFTGATARSASNLSSRVSRFVRAGDHPSIWCGEAPSEAYRALWLPANRPAIMATLIRIAGGWKTLATTFVDPPAGDSMQYRGAAQSTVAVQHESVVSSTVPEEFLALLQSVNTWTTPARRQSTEVDDGATWVMEVRRDNLYRMITRGNVPDAKFEESIRLLLRVANVVVPDEMQPPTHPD
jgi:hypothetical protein